ncbi:LOW QUALITY PROTEIN: hypothetical protein SORBI_3010G127700 [Sorghum bicolor]|uniref:Uncharacterized protein n=1 Tax=Sorghum bicolor TaxID=4558 RepID=A0A194YIR9_SORBI|nr:LOW QUALITY PROTEIN: hypothetical protein SORBI_3010G127700 [Sorghum bicolor]
MANSGAQVASLPSEWSGGGALDERDNRSEPVERDPIGPCHGGDEAAVGAELARLLEVVDAVLAEGDVEAWHRGGGGGAGGGERIGARGVAAGIGNGALGDDVVSARERSAEAAAWRSASFDAAAQSSSAIWMRSTTEATVRGASAAAAGELIVGRFAEGGDVRAGGRRGPVVRWWMGEQQGQAGRRRDAEVARGGATGAEKMRVCLV